ncbi:hypothetical protein GOV09_00830 [Candidatus Woesearchaeota archaeon]|nr:hypothetical protein [Candidatus Woesearchaeota archaeon]
MKSISSVDLHYLLKEMNFLVGGRVDKIYHPHKEELLIQFHVPSKGKQLLRIISGKFMFLSQHKERYDEPGGFCMFLRKHLDNARLREVSQVGSERIAKLVFEKEKKLSLFIELFGQGNIVVTDGETILNALNQKKWKDREIRKGKTYVFPKKEHDAFSLKQSEFEKLVSGKELVTALAKDIGLGGIYAEEICQLAAVDKKTKKVDKKVFQAMRKVIDHPIKARVLENMIVLPFAFASQEKGKEFTSFNGALDHAYIESYAKKSEFISKHQAQIDKVVGIIKSQEDHITALKKKSSDMQKKGELIYEHYKLVDEILKEIKKAREKYSFDEIKKKLKGHKIVKSIDGKTKKITLDIKG